MFLVELIWIWIVREYLVIHYPWLFNYGDKCLLDDSTCLTQAAVYRGSFFYSLFHLVLALAFIPSRYNKPYTWQYSLQYHLWPVKLVLFGGLLVLVYFIPGGFFEIYPYISITGGSIFLFIQAVLIVDFGYTWHEAWAAPYGSKWSYLLITTTSVFYSLSACIVASLFYFFFYPTPKCAQSAGVIVETVLGVVLFSIISALEKIERGSLFISSVLSFDCLLLIFGALTETDICNKLEADDTFQKLIVFTLGSFFSVIAVSYSSLYYFVAERKVSDAKIIVKHNLTESMGSMGSGGYGKMAGGHGHPHHYGAIIKDTDHLTPISPEEEKKPYSFTKFHLVFAFAGLYLGMVFAYRDSPKLATQSVIVFWVSVAVQILTSLLYIWSLVAPLFITKLQTPHKRDSIYIAAMPDQSQDWEGTKNKI
uniref:Uncharacterized protein n=1 Tax=Arcella intermedia TaxID=1963864 RepID=A0A6B2L564_9EUKA